MDDLVNPRTTISNAISWTRKSGKKNETKQQTEIIKHNKTLTIKTRSKQNTSVIQKPMEKEHVGNKYTN